jgi:hypothetical protein
MTGAAQAALARLAPLLCGQRPSPNATIFYDAWKETRRLFPEWPGFDSRRCSPELQRVYESLSAESRRELDEIERALDAGSSRS